MSGFAAELRRKRSAALTPEAATITGTSADLHVRSSDLTDLSDQLRRHDVCLDGTPSCPLRACVQNERMTGVVRLGRGEEGLSSDPCCQTRISRWRMDA
mgnify:CR=1 FL=1